MTIKTIEDVKKMIIYCRGMPIENCHNKCKYNLECSFIPSDDAPQFTNMRNKSELTDILKQILIGRIEK